MTKTQRVLRTSCPTCKARIETRDLKTAPYFPFCSRRCKLVDLGKWFDGEYCIDRPVTEEDR